MGDSNQKCKLFEFLVVCSRKSTKRNGISHRYVSVSSIYLRFNNNTNMNDWNSFRLNTNAINEIYSSPSNQRNSLKNNFQLSTWKEKKTRSVGLSCFSIERMFFYIPWKPRTKIIFWRNPFVVYRNANFSIRIRFVHIFVFIYYSPQEPLLRNENRKRAVCWAVRLARKPKNRVGFGTILSAHKIGFQNAFSIAAFNWIEQSSHSMNKINCTLCPKQNRFHYVEFILFHAIPYPFQFASKCVHRSSQAQAKNMMSGVVDTKRYFYIEKMPLIHSW